MHKFLSGIIAGCFFAIFHLLSGSLAAQEICPIPTTSGEVTYQEDWRLQWAPDNPQEIAQNQSVTLHVINGAAPYTWSVAESGFSLAATDNAGDANTLFADNTACGSATITVTDSVGDSVTGYVRCTTGQWMAYSPPDQICEWKPYYYSVAFRYWGGPSCGSYPGDVSLSTSSCGEQIVGMYKYEETIAALYSLTDEYFMCPPTNPSYRYPPYLWNDSCAWPIPDFMCISVVTGSINSTF